MQCISTTICALAILICLHVLRTKKKCLKQRKNAKNEKSAENEEKMRNIENEYLHGGTSSTTAQLPRES